MNLLQLIVRIYIIGMVVFIGIPLFLIGIVFGWKMFTGTETIEFASPSGERHLSVTNDCRFVGCMANGEIEYRIGGSRASMTCGPFPDGFSKWLFAGDARAQWRAGETRVLFRRADEGLEAAPEQERMIDLIEQCRHRVSYTWRNPGPIGFRFEENCLAAPCRRRMVLSYTGREYLFIPCSVPGVPLSVLVFSTGNDHDPNMHVDFDPRTGMAEWTSRSTGISGVVDTARDCDRGRAWKTPIPP